MADTVRTACPSCQKVYQVPTNLAGKTIRCKNCRATFPVSGRAASASSPAKPSAKAKPVAPKPTDPAAPIGFAPPPPPPARPTAEDDDDPNPYGVTHDELDIPRCPFCANELDPPDTRVCLTCGYDLLERRRHDSKKVYELSTGEYLIHWLPAIIWLIVVAAAVAVSVIFYLNMYDWLDGSILQSDDKNTATDKKTWYIEPLCFNIFTWMICIFIIQKGLRFSYQRLIVNWRPQETAKK